MESSGGSSLPTSTSPRRPHPLTRRPFLLVLGLLGLAVVIGCVAVGIWLITRKPDVDPTSSTTTTTGIQTTTTTTNLLISTTSIGPVTTESDSASTTALPPLPDIFVLIAIENTTVLHVWLKAKQEGKSAVIYANVSASDSGVESVLVTEEMGWFEFAELRMNATGLVEFSWASTETDVSYFYAYEAETLKTEGIRPAFVSDRAKHNPNIDEAFHFHPPLGWQNDPNGFSRTNDKLYHLYFQHNPHSKRWESMHWGHAVSTDLVNWVHQPIFLRPPEDKECGDNCGWYSGSAVPLDYKSNGLQLYMTNNNKTRKVRQVQMSVGSNDTILPSEEPSLLIGELPKIPPEQNINLTSDFRDPYVFLGPYGYYYMTVSSQDQNGKGCVILLYLTRTKSLDSEWDFKSVLWTDNRLGTTVCECTALVPLGDPLKHNNKYALMYSQKDSKDADQRSFLQTMIYGTFDGTKFSKITERDLDFAAGSYGHQAFYDPIAGETVLIGWLGNWPDWEDRQSDYVSGMTMPRIVRRGRNQNNLLIAPHPNVLKQLRDIELDGGALLRGNVVPLPRGTAYIKLTIDNNYLYNGVFVRINHPEYLQLGVRVTGSDGLELVKVKETDPPNRRYNVPRGLPDIVHIFIDRDSLEIFGEYKRDGIDGMSRHVGTTRLTGADNNGTFVHSVQLETSDRYVYVLNECQIWSMKRAEMRGVIDSIRVGQ